MATVEFLQKRVSGKEAEIVKLQKKMERILKAQSTDWQVNPYYYSERDLTITSKELDRTNRELADYQQKLQQEIEKSNSRNIPAIIEFLEGWKRRVTDYYTDAMDRYVVELLEWHKYNKEHCDWSNTQGHRLWMENRDEWNRIDKEYRQHKNAFQSTWNFITPYVDYKYTEGKKEYFLNTEKLQKMLDKEADVKYDFIVERTNEITGTITDATNLKVGSKGDLNGYIKGERGTAKVETIGAGGYNIQCFHFRTLIKAMK